MFTSMEKLGNEQKWESWDNGIIETLFVLCFFHIPELLCICMFRCF